MAIINFNSTAVYSMIGLLSRPQRHQPENQHTIRDWAGVQGLQCQIIRWYYDERSSDCDSTMLRMLSESGTCMHRDAPGPRLEVQCMGCRARRDDKATGRVACRGYGQPLCKLREPGFEALKDA